MEDRRGVIVDPQLGSRKRRGGGMGRGGKGKRKRKSRGFILILGPWGRMGRGRVSAYPVFVGNVNQRLTRGGDEGVGKWGKKPFEE